MSTMSVLNRSSARQDSDWVLVERARARDGVAFEELIARHGAKISRLTTRFFSTDMDRQEVLQTALLSAWRSLPTFEGRAGFGSWIFRVTTNAALMHLRGQRRRLEIAMDEVEPLAANDAGDRCHPMLGGCQGWCQRPDESMQSQELRRRLQTAVDALPERLRAVFFLRHVDGSSTEETAKALGLSTVAVRARLHRARATLRETMSDYALD
jgi:RNA polymerase sigma-70 factor (ECF subfamily)